VHLVGSCYTDIVIKLPQKNNHHHYYELLRLSPQRPIPLYLQDALRFPSFFGLPSSRCPLEWSWKVNSGKRSTVTYTRSNQMSVFNVLCNSRKHWVGSVYCSLNVKIVSLLQQARSTFTCKGKGLSHNRPSRWPKVVRVG